ncbi:MAG: sulfotransferase [Hyphococcus sp.]|nr:MAG: sulfotransferase [Marinicaulis sp.]
MSSSQLFNREDLRRVTAHYAKGQLQEAEKEVRALLERYPDEYLVLTVAGAIYLALQQFEQSISIYQRSLNVKPGDATAHNNIGVALTALGHDEEAVKSFEQAIRFNPHYISALNNMAGGLKKLGQFDEAILRYQEALSIDPRALDVCLNLAVLFVELGKYDDAIEYSQKALKLNPNSAEAYNNLGSSLAALGEIENAINAYQKTVLFLPEDANSHYNLGKALASLGRNVEAFEHFNKAQILKPDDIDISINAGAALIQSGQLEKAQETFEKILAIDPENLEALNNIGIINVSQGRHEEGIKFYQKALLQQPDLAKTHNNLAIALSQLGRIDEAIESYEKALAINPDYAECYRNLGKLKEYKPESIAFQKMKELADDAKSNDADRAQIFFALAKSYDAHGDVEAAFSCYEKGNALRKKMLKYSIDQDVELIDKVKAVFLENEDRLRADTIGISSATRPIFIVGMPRSGTTLTEQILSSHSQVYGAGERDDLNRLLIAEFSKVQVELDRLVTAGRSYIEKIDCLNLTENNFTDKLPANFMWIGFICFMFPHAKIINLDRDPKATCWSCYQQHFTGNGNGFAYDIVDAAKYYCLYMGLMEFWREKFPTRIYDLNYEALTQNQRAETQRLLENCDLDWEEACMEFHNSDGPVRTASALQVRKPIYTGSSQAWRKYADYLQPMLSVLPS